MGGGGSFDCWGFLCVLYKCKINIKYKTAWGDCCCGESEMEFKCNSNYVSIQYFFPQFPLFNGKLAKMC